MFIVNAVVILYTHLRQQRTHWNESTAALPPSRCVLGMGGETNPLTQGENCYPLATVNHANQRLHRKLHYFGITMVLHGEGKP